MTWLSAYDMNNIMQVTYNMGYQVIIWISGYGMDSL